MKKIFNLIIPVVIIGLFTLSCSKNDDDTPDGGNVQLDNPINNFVWKGMNSWYYWQPNVANLSDEKLDDYDSYYTLLNNYSNPENLFYDLCYQHESKVSSGSAVDRFSWFIEDYEVHQQGQVGISTSFGLRLKGVTFSNNPGAILYVRNVAHDSPASDAGIKRGDIINAIDDVELTSENYGATVSKLSNETVKLSFVAESNGVLTSTGDKSITRRQVYENPVHFSKIFNNINGKKVGYLVYNSFKYVYHSELNAVFQEFKNEGIDELVLDLRINGGGFVITASYLASMIYGNASSDEVVSELRFNEKHTEENGYYYFSDNLNTYNNDGIKTGDEPMNRLTGLNRLYVLTSDNTASASEMIINGIRPFIPVKVVGTTTYGKGMGSITLYDSPSTDFMGSTTANTAHKNAMQPISFLNVNGQGEMDFVYGFEPDIEVKEWNYWNEILEYGDENEVVLKAALDDIRGLSSKRSEVVKDVSPRRVKPLEGKFDTDMLILPDFFKNK